MEGLPIEERTAPAQSGEVPGQSTARPGRFSDTAFLAVLLVGTFMAVLDAFVVNVAIPSIRAGLGASRAEIELVVAVYFLTYACLMITGGRLGDIFDRKRAFLAGMALFTLSSATCGLAPNAPVLIASRAIQGVGAALMYPQILSMIQIRFKGVRRSVALGAYATVIGVAAVAGQLIGGALVQANIDGLDWRAVFLVNVPIGIVGVLLGYWVLVGSRADPRPTLDVGGVLLISAALASLIVSITLVASNGWSVATVALLAAVPFLLWAFAAVERREARGGGFPVVSPNLFRQRGFSLGIPIALLYFFGIAGLFYTLAVFLQSGLGLTPVSAGETFSALGLGFIVTSILSPRAAVRWGKFVLVVGYGVSTLGAISALALIELRGTSFTAIELVPVLFVIGLGNGFGMSPLVGSILARVRDRDVGPASGVLATSIQIGQGVGVAVLGLIFYQALGTPTRPGASLVSIYGHAFVLALAVIAGVFATSLVLALALPAPTAAENDRLLAADPRRLSRLAYSFYFFTGGRIGRPLVDQILDETRARRFASIDSAPVDFGEFLVHHYRRSASEREFFRFLTREALEEFDRAGPMDAVREEVIRRSVEEIRDRQSSGVLRADMDPASLRLMAFALVTYPRVYRKVAHHVLGLDPDDPTFDARWEEFLRRLGRTITSVSGERDSASKRPPPEQR